MIYIGLAGGFGVGCVVGYLVCNWRWSTWLRGKFMPKVSTLNAILSANKLIKRAE